MFTRPKNHEPIPWRHGVVSTPLLTTGFIYVGGLGIGLAADAGHTLPLSMMGLGSAAGVVIASSARWFRTRTQHRVPRAYHTAFTGLWTSATYAWFTHAAHGVPWTLESAATVGLAAAAITPLYGVDRWFREEQIAAQWQAEIAETKADLNEWEDLFAKAGACGVHVEDSTPTRSGYDLPLTLTGTPIEQLFPMLSRIEVLKGDIRTGALTLRRGDLASRAVLSVATRNVLTEVINLPADAHPITINEPLTTGILESGEPIEILFRQNSILIAGKKGSGKSVTLHVLISLITRCVDAVIWMVDMAQGNTAKRWLRPWIEGWNDADGQPIDRPILDWVATTPEEAFRLYSAAHDIADGRARRMKGGKIIPSKAVPAIIVISDENSDLMAWNPEAAKPKTRGIKKGRKAAIDYVDAVQRGTGPNTGGGEISSQYDTVIGMKFAKKAEGQFVFPDYYGQVNLAHLPGYGSLYILDEGRQVQGGTGPERGKSFYTDDSDDTDNIEQLSAERWKIRPDLDDASQADAAPYGYADRWSDPARVEWLLDACGVSSSPLPAQATSTSPAAGTAKTMPTGPLSLPPMQHYLDKYPNWRPNSAPTGDDPQTAAAIAAGLAEFERIKEQAVLNRPKNSDDRKHPRRDEVIAMVRSAGPDGISIDECRNRLAQQHPDEKVPSRQAVTGWFTAHPNIERPEGARGLYAWTTGADADAAQTQRINDVLPLAIEQVIAKQHASTAMLQRNLRVNAADATALMTFLEQQGIVGPARADGSHEVLLTADQYRNAIDGTEAGE